MAVQTRAIKRRIKSVKNTRKITKAMELVAASKMRKAVASVLGTRPYASLAWASVSALAEIAELDHPLLRARGKPERVLLVLFASDRGLAGGFNTSIMRHALVVLASLGEKANVDAICVGKRASDAMRKMGRPVIAAFAELSNNPRFEDILPLSRLILDEFTQGTYEKVMLCYTDFVSAIAQKPMVMDLLPIPAPQPSFQRGEATQYLFEPSPVSVLDRLLPRITEAMIFQALLESSASEHAARMMAMRSASDAAADMIDDLTFTFNQVRQAGITQEIAEISSGKAALEQKSD